MTLSIIGHGYVGLVTACVFADFGNDVWVIGHTKKKIEQLKQGDPIIYEPGLKELLEKNLRAQRLHFVLNYEKAIGQSDIVFITVGTPPAKNGEADLSAVFEVATQIGKHLKKGFTVVSCKSTVLVGTNKKVEEILLKKKPSNAEVGIASCPEFLREGTALTDTLHPDRVVIGSDNKKAINLLLELHKPLSGERVITDLASAELIKYTANAMLATKISFANLISFYCEKTGADVETVLDAVGLDKRIGRIFMYPGVGYGGSCLPKDVNALIHTGKSFGIDATLLETVEKINEDARKNFLEKILINTKGKSIAIWGLSFKPDTDDIRAASSQFIIQELLNRGYRIATYDAAAEENIRKLFGEKIRYSDNMYDCVSNANVLCILTEWNEFKQADLQKVKSLMKDPIIIDGRNIYQPDSVKKLGFTYISTGRKLVG
ncbi:UDP-glucose/GDP-mannose dehydrogenase family protein [Candidatus Roizmanbacteria bacterium]|nr:UDP-glucose/GDP-mannose dehydrogenase family protein [Candidatus Roizmanbacteria bacterium]